MRVPAFLCGTEEEVVQRCADRAREVVDGGVLWDEPIDEIDLVADGLQMLVVINGPSALLAGERHFHAWALLPPIWRHGDGQIGTTDRVFGEAVRTFSGLASLLAVVNQVWLGPSERHRPFLAAVRFRRPMLEELDGRFTIGLNTGGELGSLATNIQYALACAGGDIDRLRSTRCTAELLDIVDAVV
jgi:hypothetical protein